VSHPQVRDRGGDGARGEDPRRGDEVRQQDDDGVLADGERAEDDLRRQQHHRDDERPPQQPRRISAEREGGEPDEPQPHDDGDEPVEPLDEAGPVGGEQPEEAIAQRPPPRTREARAGRGGVDADRHEQPHTDGADGGATAEHPVHTDGPRATD
jgi:hypothetical protein